MPSLEELVARAKAEAKASPVSKPASKIWHEASRTPDLIPETYIIRTRTETCPSCGERNEEFLGFYIKFKSARGTVERLIKPPYKIEYPRLACTLAHESDISLCGHCAIDNIEALFEEAKNAPR